MWNWFICFLSGRHNFDMWCEPGAIFLRCVNCGRRSPGWSLEPTPQPGATDSKAQAPLVVDRAA